MSRTAIFLIISATFGPAKSSWAQGCPYADSTAVPDTLDPALYYPMRVGNRWDYVNPNQPPYYNFFSDVIAADTLVGDARFYRFERQFYGASRDGWVATPHPEVRYLAIVDSELVSWTPEHPVESTGQNLASYFNSCETSPTGGSYGGQIEVPQADSIALIDVAATKCFGDDRKRVCYAYGIGMYEHFGTPDQTQDLVFAQIGKRQIGTPLSDLYHFAPAIPDTLDWRGYYPLHLGDAWEVETVDVGFYSIARREIVGDTLISGNRYFVQSSYLAWHYESGGGSSGTSRDTTFVRYDTTAARVVGVSHEGAPEEALTCNLAVDFDTFDPDCQPVADAFVEGDPGGFFRLAGDTVRYAAVKGYYNLGGGVSYYHGIGPLNGVGDGSEAGNGFAYIRVNGKEYGQQKVFDAVEDELPDPHSGFELYPDPARSFIVLEFPADVGANSVWVYDALGRLVTRKRDCSARCEVSLTSFASGMYVAQAKLPSGRVVSKPFVLVSHGP